MTLLRLQTPFHSLYLRPKGAFVFLGEPRHRIFAPRQSRRSLSIRFTTRWRGMILSRRIVKRRYLGRQTSLKIGFCVRFVVLRTNFLSKIDFGWIVNFLQGRKGIFNLVKGTRYGFLGKKRKDIGFGY